MQVNSSVVGQKMRVFQTEVTQRQINNYAAAVGDPNPCYLDDARQNGLIAPPTLAAALTWPLLQNIYDYLDLGFPAEIMFRIVHYSEQLVIERPLKPGDRLSIEGQVVAVIPEKSGTHVIFKLPALDQGGNLVFTEYIGGMLRGVECTDLGRTTGKLPVIPALPEISKPIWEAAVPIKREDCYIYEGCADVPFPIHTSPSFARSMGLPDIIYFGIGTLARAVSALVNRELGTDPAGIRHLACIFRGMVTPESFIRIQLLERKQNDTGLELFFRVLNQQGKEAVSEGYLRSAH
jgi:acyl dehydratase